MYSTQRPIWLRTVAVLLMAGSAITLNACGDDDNAAAVDTTADPIPVPSIRGGGVATTDAPALQSVQVGLADFEFLDLPAYVTPGTAIDVRNDSATELHELVAVRLDDDDDRDVSDIVAGDLEAVFAAAPPALVVMATPGSAADIVAVGDGVLHEAGRYLIICTIPTGVDPQDYLDAAAAAGGGRPEVPGGPPHFVNGMYGEVIVDDA